jgi:hypothetical protein
LSAADQLRPRSVELVPRLIRSVTVIFVAVLALVVLAGCDPVFDPHAPIAMQQRDGVFVMTVCSGINVENLVASSRGSGRSVEWQTFFLAKGPYKLEKGATISSSTAPAHMTVTEWHAPSLTAGDKVFVTLTRIDSESNVTINAQVQVPAGGMPEVRWLRADGTIATKPCR